MAPTVFLQMAWLANPFAYVAINTVVAVIPGLARQFNLSPTWVGVFCSIWFFARLATFLLLWHWTGWHYRFRWFLGAFLLIIAAFTVILNVPSLTAIVVAQIFFGGALGLIYYSSLFYSMDVGETKGEHGGLHEAAIGVGIFLGPATGAAALYLCPASPGAGPLAVAGLLVCGLAGVIRLRIKGTSGRPANPPGPAV